MIDIFFFSQKYAASFVENGYEHKMDLAELKEEVRFDLMIIMRSLKSVRITQISPTIVGNKGFKIDSILLLFSYYYKGMNNPSSTTYVTILTVIILISNSHERYLFYFVLLNFWALQCCQFSFAFHLNGKLSITLMVSQDLKEISAEEADTVELLYHIKKIPLVKISDDIPVSYLNNCIRVH